MVDASHSEGSDNARIVLGLLESVERDGGQSQRRLASDLGIALGLVNAYLKRCVKKGLVKVGDAPARRYVYYLTPKGFAEKSRLTVEYLSHSLSFFRQAKSECMGVLQIASAQGLHRIVLAGRSELAEIAIICALECTVEVVAIVDSESAGSPFMGKPSYSSFEDIEQPFDGIMVTDLMASQSTYQAALARVRPDRVLVPRMLPVNQNMPGQD